VAFHEVEAMARNVVQFQKGLSEPAFAGRSSLRHAGRVALNARYAAAGSIVW
jgi:hypothetical protein